MVPVKCPECNSDVSPEGGGTEEYCQGEIVDPSASWRFVSCMKDAYNPYMTVGTAARLLGCDPGTVFSLVREGVSPEPQKVGLSKLFLKVEIEPILKRV